MISTFLKRIAGTVRNRTSILPQPPKHKPRITYIKSEPLERYRPGGYHSVRIGDVFEDRFKVRGKLGWGRFSTVWEAIDTRSDTAVALKILTSDCTSGPSALDELGTLELVNSRNRRHPGYSHIQQLLGHFMLEGPNGTHVCLVLERLRDSLDMLWRNERGVRFPLPIDLVKKVSRDVLLALTYLHDECRLVHTDIKPDNILLTDPKRVPEGGSQPGSVDDSGLWDPLEADFKLIDLGHANLVDKPFATLIQPFALRAPEAILGLPWGTPADMWNLGCLLYELVVDPTHTTADTTPAYASDEVITLLGLQKHPEGGYFRRTHQEPTESPSPYADGQLRPLATSIHYFLTADSPSSLFHMNKSATIHAVHQGRAEYTLIYLEERDGEPPRVERVILGLDIARGEKLQLYVGSNVWKKSKLLDQDVRRAETDPSFRAQLGCLISEVVFPGFVWEDHKYLHKCELQRMWGEDSDAWREWVEYTKE